MDLNVLLAETAPAPESPPPDALVTARARLDEAAAAAGRNLRAMHVVKVRRHRRRLLIASIAAAAALVLVPVLGNGTGTAPSAAAAEVMLAAADVAGAQHGDWSDAPYWHIARELDYPSTPGQEPFLQELWFAHTGNSVMSSTDPAVPSGPDGPLYEDAGPTGFSAGGWVDWDGLYALPTDPGELEAILRSGINGAGPDDDTELWEIVTGLLVDSPASPTLRAALWQVAATIPGVELVGHVTDALGRPGVAIERDMTDAGWSRVRYILDPVDGQVLEEQSYGPDGDLGYRMTILDQGPVATAPTPDPPYCGPGSDPYKSC